MFLAQPTPKDCGRAELKGELVSRLVVLAQSTPKDCSRAEFKGETKRRTSWPENVKHTHIYIYIVVVYYCIYIWIDR